MHLSKGALQPDRQELVKAMEIEQQDSSAFGDTQVEARSRGVLLSVLFPACPFFPPINSTAGDMQDT
jgi:hypothetical protein